MPLYEYQCLPNKHRFELRHGMTETPVLTCPQCGADVRRVIQPVGILFKGSGFYATDSRKPAAAPKATSAGSSDGKSDPAPAAEKKSEGTSPSDKPTAPKKSEPGAR